MRMGALAGAVAAFVALSLVAGEGSAQCATCGNPAFVGANRDISQSFDAGKAALWRAHAALLYGIGGADTYYHNDEAIENIDDLKMRMHVVSLVASGDAPWGTTASLTVPWARLDSERRFYGESSDQGLGDLELRLGQDVLSLLGLRTSWLSRAVVSLGAVAPTGVYVERADALANKKVDVTADPDCLTCGDFCPDHCTTPAPTTTDADLFDDGSSRYLSIGRGSWWLVVDGELGGSLHKRLGWYLGATYRRPLNDAPDSFGWGAEQRVGVGFSGVLWPGAVTAQVLGEYDRREMSTDGGVLFDNGGGHFITISPTLQAMLGDQMTLSVTWRQPVVRDVIGVQAVEGPSVWVTVGGRMSFGDARTAATPSTQQAPSKLAAAVDKTALRKALAESPGRAQEGKPPANKEIADLLVPGQTTIVDYWADWCQPCVRLGAEFKAYAATNPKGVVVKKVDASSWSEAQWVRLLPDVPTMPAVDIYGPDGKLIVRLRSDYAFGWRDHLPAAP